MSKKKLEQLDIVMHKMADKIAELERKVGMLQRVNTKHEEARLYEFTAAVRKEVKDLIQKIVPRIIWKNTTVNVELSGTGFRNKSFLSKPYYNLLKVRIVSNRPLSSGKEIVIQSYSLENLEHEIKKYSRKTLKNLLLPRYIR